MKKTRIIIFVIIICICVAAIGITLAVQMTENDYKKAVNKTNETEEITADEIDKIKNNFNNTFKNDVSGEYENIKKEKEEKDVVYVAAQKVEVIPNKYDLDVQIPQINIDNEDVKKCNSEIKNVFQNKASNILSGNNEYIIYKVKYHAYINENILSIIVKANLKEGENPEREIIKTYNYNLETNKIVTLNDIIENKNINKEDIEKQIKQEIDSKKEYEKTLTQLGYETYTRDINDEMYKFENINNFILGEDGMLYIIYAYGNKTYTSETDLIII